MPSLDEEYKDLRTKIKKEIEPLLNNLLTTKDEDLLQFREEYLKFLENCFSYLSILNSFTIESDVKTLRTSIKEQVFLLYHYLGMVESVGNWVANILVMLLVANGKDFHIEARESPRVRHVTSIDDLQETYVPLTTKLNFLRDNKITTFPSIIDSKLRNDIAHFNFKVGESVVTIRGKEVWEVVYPSLRKIQGVSRIVIELFEELAKELGW